MIPPGKIVDKEEPMQTVANHIIIALLQVLLLSTGGKKISVFLLYSKGYARAPAFQNSPVVLELSAMACW